MLPSLTPISRIVTSRYIQYVVGERPIPHPPGGGPPGVPPGQMPNVQAINYYTGNSGTMEPPCWEVVFEDDTRVVVKDVVEEYHA